MEPIEHLTEPTFESPRRRRDRGLRMRSRVSRPNETLRWPLERVLFALAGTVTLLSAVLAVAVSNWFLLLTAFVGVNQWLYVVVGACPASIVLRRACRLRSAIYEKPEANAV
jgi:hypothetical protein